MSTPCVITGCALVSEFGKWVSGDLFDAGAYWLFNGNYDGALRCPAWQRDGAPPFYQRHIRATDWWERRGVFLIDKARAELNQAAREYIVGTSA